jgi:hypothetical protein
MRKLLDVTRIKHQPLTTNSMYHANAALNITTDLLVAALPVRQIWKLQIAMRQKIALLAILTLGWLYVHSLSPHPVKHTYQSPQRRHHLRTPSLLPRPRRQTPHRSNLVLRSRSILVRPRSQPRHRLRLHARAKTPHHQDHTVIRYALWHVEAVTSFFVARFARQWFHAVEGEAESRYHA